MYDGTNNYTVPNPIGRYSLGSDDPLKADADGSVTIHLQRESPGKERESNWLPTPSGPFYIILRAYAPGKAMIEALEDPKAYLAAGGESREIVAVPRRDPRRSRPA